jgi:hypothetical protein
MENRPGAREQPARRGRASRALGPEPRCERSKKVLRPENVGRTAASNDRFLVVSQRGVSTQGGRSGCDCHLTGVALVRFGPTNLQ